MFGRVPDRGAADIAVAVQRRPARLGDGVPQAQLPLDLIDDGTATCAGELRAELREVNWRKEEVSGELIGVGQSVSMEVTRTRETV